MKETGPNADTFVDFEAARAAHGADRYLLHLYVTGTTALAMRALVNIRAICEEHLQGRYDLQVIDLSQQPTLAASEQIIGAPTLIKSLPLPLRRFLGDMSQTQRILRGLDLDTTQETRGAMRVSE